MSLLPALLSRTLAAVTAADLVGVTQIKPYAFYLQSNLNTFEIPRSINYIGGAAFSGCSALETINSNNMNPECLMFSQTTGFNTWIDTAWLANQPANSMVTMANGKILVGNTITDQASGFVIPSTVTNVAPFSCQKFSENGTALTKVILPDSVEMIQANAFAGQSSLAQITIGASVRRILGLITPSGTSVTTLIFRQPAGMTIDLPTPGSANGMAYNKDSRPISIYTDNDLIKNYGWATDNVTATIYPLSSAPA